jgi:hypothetical protein
MRRIDDIGQQELGHLPQVAVPNNRRILRIISLVGVSSPFPSEA